MPKSCLRFLAMVSLSHSSVDAEVRVWESADGRKIEAEFVKIEAGVVHLDPDAGLPFVEAFLATRCGKS